MHTLLANHVFALSFSRPLRLFVCLPLHIRRHFTNKICSKMLTIIPRPFCPTPSAQTSVSWSLHAGLPQTPHAQATTTPSLVATETL
jgi:hypothetical protein